MKQSQQRIYSRQPGFTVIELLVVIAIIAILTAILFPVFKSVRDSNRKAQCETNLMMIGQALNMYKDDWKTYPDALYGVSAAGGPVGIRLYANEYHIKDVSIFTCPSSPAQFKGNSSLVTPINPMTNSAAVNLQGNPIQFVAFDSYDSQFIGGKQLLNYSLKWSTGSPGLTDDKRQLYQRDPPGNTVVTWCRYHSVDGAGNPISGSKAPVLLLSGAVKQVPITSLLNWSGPNGSYPWQVTP